MKRAIVFPGQGSQQVGMGKELAQNFEVARFAFEEMDDVLGQKLSTIMFEGPEEELRRTENAQPAIMANSIAMLRVLEREAKLKPEEYATFFAGHSLGEYTALCAARSISFEDTLRLLRLRGQSMQKAVPEDEGAMAALLGYSFDKANMLINSVARYGVCAIANDNSPEQVVISGTKKLVQQAVEMAQADGAGKAIMLQVSAPFHCALMQPAAVIMEEALAKVEVRVPMRPIVANVTASAVTDPVEIRKLLVQQVTGRVRWRESVQYMVKQGVAFALELGEGKVLSGLIRRIDPGISPMAVGQLKDIEVFCRQLA